jgi:hypothetical protein
VLVPRICDRRKSDCNPTKRFFFMPSSTASATSSHLRDLLSSLDVDGAASLARRDGGVVDTVRRNDTGEGDSYSGTSRKSTLCDAPVTVVSGLDMELDEKRFLEEEGSSPVIKKRSTFPRGVGMQLPKYTGPVKTFSVMRLSNDLDVFSLICRSTIGKSGTFCISRDCLVNHQGTVAKVKPGSLVVVKSPGRTAFLHPVIKSDLFDQSLLGDWLSTQETLEVWTTKFDQVLGSSTFFTKVNAAALEVTREEERRAADFKTPRAKKRRSSEFDTTERIGISPYARHLVNGPETFEVMSEQEQIEKLVQMVIGLDAGVDQLGSFYVALSQDLEKSTNAQGLSNQMSEHKVNLLRRTLGSKPDHLKTDIESPTVWGAMAVLLEKSENATVGKPETSVEDQKEVNNLRVECNKRLASLETDITATASTLSRAVQAQGQRIDAVQGSTRRAPLGQPITDSAETEALKEDVKGIRSEVQKITNENKPHMVKFAGLNLDSAAKARSWISAHVASEDIGLVVDPHTVFEHIQANVSGGEFLKNFEKVHKLEISTLAQGYSMTSFEQPIPKFLGKAGSTVIKDDSSYLEKIPNWNDWDYPDTGLRQSLNHELEIFNRSHRLEIESTLDEDSRVYAVACLALSDSVSIIESLVKFIDTFVKQLTTAKFSIKKAFHVTTRLAKRILTEMYEPRQGVLKSFKAGNMEKTAASIFWATIRSLDIGLGFKRTGFENLHIVSSELVKFLLVNTGYESITELETKVSVLEGQVSDLQKTSRNSEKSAVTASNKADELKKLSDSLVKRITKLETRST